MTQDIHACLCIPVTHAKCYQVGEHVCLPCECDCHYPNLEESA